MDSLESIRGFQRNVKQGEPLHSLQLLESLKFRNCGRCWTS